MRKVMIVDDERWIRRGMIQSISWDRFGLELAGEAGDGKEAYDMALEKKPDILFLDMRMPGLDGKQLIGMLNRDLPDLLTVVVSGYSDFEYTREAIRHKAFDYLLKPVKKEELAALLEKAVIELDRREQERRKASRDSGEDWLRQLLFHAEEDGEPSVMLDDGAIPSDWKTGECAMMVGQPDSYGDHGEYAQQLVAVLREQLDRNRPFLFGGQWHFEATAGGDGFREAVVAIGGAQLEHTDFLRLASIVQTVIKQTGSLSYSLGFSKKKNGPLKLRESYLEARQVLTSKPLGTAGTVLFAGEETQGEKIVGEMKKLIEAQYGQQLSLHQMAASHFINPDYLSRIFKKSTGKNFVDYLADIRINKAKELMKISKYKNYEIAQMVGYEDYRYFSQIFKKKIGMTIGEYRHTIGLAHH